MKKKLIALLIAYATVTVGAFGLAGCTGNPSAPAHTHNYVWTDNGDGTHQQHCSIPNCDEPDVNVEGHVWGTDNKCEMCGADIPVHRHTYSDEWTSMGSEGHCHIATCEHTDEFTEIVPHVYDDETDSSCNYCGYAREVIPPHSHVWSPDWQRNETHHWHNCTAEGCIVTDNALKNGYAEHLYDQNNRCVCGKRNPSVITEGLAYELNYDNESYRVTGIGTATETDIVIASEYNSKPVTKISEDAFKNCTSLTSLTIPDSVTSIGSYAFYYCSSLTSIDIPDSVTSIGGSVFMGCSSLQYNEYDNARYLGNDTNKHTWLIEAKNTWISTCSIHEDTKYIFASAFSQCGWLTEIIIPDGVTSIGDYAFTGTGLRSITIPDSVTSIGGSAFLDCRSLQYNEYDNAYYLGNDTNKYIVLVKAKDTAITSCTIYESTKFICDYAFGGCSELTGITIPDGITRIGNGIFNDCYNLTNVTIPDSVTSISYSAFSSCIGLSVYYNGDMKTWCETEISGRNDLMSAIKELYIDGQKITGELIIPRNVTNIGDYAFQYCSGLASITIPDSVTSIGGSVFMGCNALTIYCEATEMPNSWRNNWNFYGPVVWDCKNNDKDWDGYAYDVIDGVRYSFKDGIAAVIRQPSNIVTAYIPTTVSYLNIVYDVTSIDGSAFYDCNLLESITVDESNTNYASQDGILYGKDKTEFIHIPTAIKGTITIPDGVTSIGMNTDAFSGCTGITSITIPDSVSSIGSYAFYDCRGLESITITDKVTYIGNSAFCGCSGLTSIAFGGTKEQWNNINKGNDWSTNTNSFIIQCTNGRLDKDGNVIE